MSVSNLSAHRNKDTIHALRTLLEQAENGDIEGIMFCVKQPDKAHAMGLTGVYAAEPSRALEATTRLQHRLNLRIDQTEREPHRRVS